MSDRISDLLLNLLLKREAIQGPPDALSYLKAERDYVKQLETALERAREQMIDQAMRAEKAETALARVRELPENWRTWAGTLYRKEPANKLCDCAVELEAALREPEQ